MSTDAVQWMYVDVFYTDSTGVTDCYGVGRDVSSAGLQF